VHDDIVKVSRSCARNYNREYPGGDEADIFANYAGSTEISQDQARFLLGPDVGQAKNPTATFHLHSDCTGVFVSAVDKREETRRVLVTFLRIHQEKKRIAAFHNFLGKAPQKRSSFPRGRRQVRILDNLGYSPEELRQWAEDPARQVKPEGETYNRVLPVTLRPHMAFRARRGEEFLVFRGADEVYLIPRDQCAEPKKLDPFYSDDRYFPGEGGLLTWRTQGSIQDSTGQDLRPDQVNLTKDFCRALQNYGPLRLGGKTKAQVADYVAYNLLRHPPHVFLKGDQYYGLVELYFEGDSHPFPAYFAMREGKWVVSVDPFPEAVPYKPSPEEEMYRDYLLKKGWTVQPPGVRQEGAASGKGS